MIFARHTRKNNGQPDGSSGANDAQPIPELHSISERGQVNTRIPRTVSEDQPNVRFANWKMYGNDAYAVGCERRTIKSEAIGKAHHNGDGKPVGRGNEQ